MRGGRTLKIAVAVVMVAWLALEAGAGDPVFVRWLVPGDPGDETIRAYWERLEAGELDPREMVDLGTMLFYRGYPKDAVRVYRQALDADHELYEAWFRIGLVEHRAGRTRQARVAYRRCLKILKGHGWCNFYLGLLEEQDGHPDRALEHYRRAFKVAPELSDPQVNPEMLSSDLAVGAMIRHFNKASFVATLPMEFLQPGEVARVRSRFEPKPTPPAEETPSQAETLAPTPAATPSPSKVIGEQPGSAAAAEPTGSSGGEATGVTEDQLRPERRRMTREDFLRQRGRLPDSRDGSVSPGAEGGSGVAGPVDQGVPSVSGEGF